MIEILTIKTDKRKDMIDVTSRIKNIVRKSSIKSGICLLFVPHTTAAVTINENADPSVKRDLIKIFRKLVPEDPSYEHSEGNSDSHAQSSMLGPSLPLIIENSDLVLGTWQGVYFCEFDGPRTRRLIVKIVPDI